jgi:hypothetical protein
MQHVEPPSAVVVARATGVLLVVYSFLFGLWPDVHGQRFELVTEMREWVNRPLGIGEDFGPLGITLLLLASGFAATARSSNLLGRLLRVYLPVLAGAIVASCLVAFGAEVLPGASGAQPSASSVLWDAVLATHLAPGAVPLLALGWVLCVELFSTLAGALTAGPRSAWLVPLGQLAVVAVLILLGEPVAHLALVVSYLPVAVLGQLLGSFHAKRAPGWALLLLGVAAWGLIAWAEKSFTRLDGWWYPLAACYGLLYFVTTARMTLTARTRVVTDWLTARSRWLLVFTGTIGWAVIGLARGAMSFPLAALLGTLAVVLAAELALRGSALLTGRLRLEVAA